MADETITYSKLKNKNNHQETTELKENLQDLLAEPESDENTIMIHETEAKLETHETKLLYDILSKKTNFNLFENERPSNSFLNMENSKSGYSEITKLRIPNPNYNNTLPNTAQNIPFFTITDGDLIRYNMTEAFQTIFNKQPNLKTDKHDIIDFLNSDNDTKPLEELKKKNYLNNKP